MMVIMPVKCDILNLCAADIQSIISELNIFYCQLLKLTLPFRPLPLAKPLSSYTALK